MISKGCFVQGAFEETSEPLPDREPGPSVFPEMVMTKKALKRKLQAVRFSFYSCFSFLFLRSVVIMADLVSSFTLFFVLSFFKLQS